MKNLEHVKLNICTEKHKIYARLVRQTYRKKRPEVEEEWARLEEFDTPTSAVWFNGVECLLTVVAPETRYRKIEEVTSVDNTLLVSSLSTLSAEYPHLPVTVATHSFGYELFLNTILLVFLSSIVLISLAFISNYGNRVTKSKVLEAFTTFRFSI